MDLNQFTWDRTDEQASIELRLTQMPDGSCEIRNLNNSDEMYTAESPRATAEAMQDLVSQPH